PARGRRDRSARRGHGPPELPAPSGSRRALPGPARRRTRRSARRGAGPSLAPPASATRPIRRRARRAAATRTHSTVPARTDSARPSGRSRDGGDDVVDDRTGETVGQLGVTVQDAVVEGAVEEVEGDLDI